ncbi:hypothetical protein PODOV005v1_20009 [Vibrio phage PS32B.2]|nr:hypothetical protein PODOV005v1_20009 [Vibrio phage PS32B.2]QZI86405.1 hypothetical protein PODOV029v1_40004 [Vibrio phage PS35B.1]QZI86460.1 hypothetical protein PODOV027v1_10051 [Vibrio phage PS35B.3]QZI92184.1 hypothetical protein PODOV026v1_p0011 [Vibrio phage PS32B.1]QZI92308.1 hypothetical protein PODOV025v1_p0011 [Vibrio phage PS32B.6]
MEYLITIIGDTYMYPSDYNLMQVGVMYDASYRLDGRVCVIKKAAEDTSLGAVTCQFEDGTIRRRHFAFFQRFGISKHQTFRTV